MTETVCSLLILLERGKVTVKDHTERKRLQQLQRLLGCGFSMQNPIITSSFKPGIKEKWLVRQNIVIPESIREDIGSNIKEVEENVKETEKQSFICHYCGKLFFKRKALSDHVRNVHSSKKYCDLCPQEFSTSMNMLRHKREIHIEWEGMFECDICGRKFKRREDFQCHVTKCFNPKNKTTRKRQEECECQYCRRKFTRKHSLKDHIETRHTIRNQEQGVMVVANILSRYKKLKKDYICKTCPQLRRFASKYNLKRHTLSKHGGRTDIIRFGTGYMKLSTQQQNENIDRRSVCKICNITLSCFDELQHHNTLHHKKEKYQCMICLKSFNKKCSLRLHERTQHKKKEYQCTICFKQFLDIYHLARHSKIHTKVKKHRALKPIELLSRKQLLRRMRKQAKEINLQLNEISEAGKEIVWKELVKYYPNTLDSKKEPLTEEEVIEMIRDANLSDRTMLIILKKIRAKWGMKAITPNIRKHLIERKTITDRFFTYRLLTASGPGKTDIYFKSKNGDPLTRYVAFCHDIPGLISWKRLLENDNEAEYMNIIGVDDGKKILKICWNWSQKHKDDGVNKLMGPKKSILLGREYKKLRFFQV